MGNSLGVVTAEDELIHDLHDPFDSKSTIDNRVFVFVLIGEPLKMFLEQKLDGVDPPRLIDHLLRRSELKGQLISHIII